MLVAENKMFGGSLWDELQLGSLLAESGAVLNSGLVLSSPPKHNIISPTSKLQLSPTQGKAISRLADPIRGRYFKYDELMSSGSTTNTTKKHNSNHTAQSQYTTQQHSQVADLCCPNVTLT